MQLVGASCAGLITCQTGVPGAILTGAPAMVQHPISTLGAQALCLDDVSMSVTVRLPLRKHACIRGI